MKTPAPPIPPKIQSINKSNLSYAWLIIIMFAIAVGGALGIEAIRPEKDNTILIGLIFGFCTTTTPAIMAFMKAQETAEVAKETHSLINSQLAEWKAAMEKSSFTDGEKQGRADADARTDALNKG